MKKLTPDTVYRHGITYGILLTTSTACIGLWLAAGNMNDTFSTAIGRAIYGLYLFPIAAVLMSILIGGLVLRRKGYLHSFRFSFLGGFVAIGIPFLIAFWFFGSTFSFALSFMSFPPDIRSSAILAVGLGLTIVAPSLLGGIVFRRIASKIPDISQRENRLVWSAGSAWLRRHAVFFVVLPVAVVLSMTILFYVLKTMAQLEVM